MTWRDASLGKTMMSVPFFELHVARAIRSGRTLQAFALTFDEDVTGVATCDTILENLGLGVVSSLHSVQRVTIVLGEAQVTSIDIVYLISNPFGQRW